MKNRQKAGVINTNALLKRVSRSFYITLRILPGSVRPQLSLAYLLARATDTVADTEAIAADKRQRVLSELCRCIQTVSARQEPSVPDLSAFLRTNHAKSSANDDAEMELLVNFKVLLDALYELSEDDRKSIAATLETITRGQQEDIRRFDSAGERLNALATDDELDMYTYDVAGCVGEFWTKICLAHVFTRNSLDEKQIMPDAVRFGKGLQLVNILRDLPEDLRQGRCYIPEQSLRKFGMTPADLLNPDSMRRFEPLYDDYLECAEEHLRAGWRYTTALPFGCVRVRLACAWPILIGIKTLRSLRGKNILGGTRIKITRREIRRILVKSVFLYPRRDAWRSLFNTQL